MIGRVAGAGVLGLSVASWLVRGDSGARSQFGLLTGLLIYNAVAVVLLVVAGAVLKMEERTRSAFPRHAGHLRSPSR